MPLKIATLLLEYIVEILLFLISSNPLVTDYKKLQKLISMSATEIGAILDISILDLELFNILEKAYLTHFLPAMITFGTRNLSRRIDLSMNILNKISDKTLEINII